MTELWPRPMSFVYDYDVRFFGAGSLKSKRDSSSCWCRYMYDSGANSVLMNKYKLTIWWLRKVHFIVLHAFNQCKHYFIGQTFPSEIDQRMCSIETSELIRFCELCSACWFRGNISNTLRGGAKPDGSFCRVLVMLFFFFSKVYIFY